RRAGVTMYACVRVHKFHGSAYARSSKPRSNFYGTLSADFRRHCVDPLWHTEYMRCCIHIVTDSERIVDPDGEEFADIEAARLDACQSARDLMAGELVGGRPVPLGWQAQIASIDGTGLLTVPVSSLLFSNNDALAKVLQSLPRV